MRIRHHGAPPKNRNDWKTIRTLMTYIWDFKGRVVFAFALLGLAKVANVGVPLVLKEIVDSLDKPKALLILPLFFLLAYGALRLSSSLFAELRDAVFAKVIQRAIRKSALKVFSHLHILGLSFHLDRQTGGVSRDIERGTHGIRFLLNFMIFNILPTLFEILLVAVILFIHYDPWFGIVIFISLIIYIGFTLVITEWRMIFRRTMNAMDSKANTNAIDSLINYETVKYFNNEDYEARRYDNNLATWEKAAVKNQTSLSALNIGQSIIIALSITTLMLLAADGVSKGNMSLGDLVMINAFMIQLYIPLNFLGFVYREIRHSLADMERMFGLLEQDPDVKDREGAAPLQIRQGTICFEHISFSYNANRQIIFDASFDVPAGHKVAVVGSSGDGKSTIARLLFRFYDATEGRILIDGQDIRDVTLDSLRANIGVVPQDTVLFNDTIYYNIAYGHPDANRQAIEDAARRAHIHDFITSLPDAYDTMVGERVLKLSGGSRMTCGTWSS